jgi:hypothetical protein
MSNQSPDPEYVLRGVAGVVFGRSFHLLTPTTLGRAAECDICIADQGISRMHARLRPLDYGLEIEDLKSTNGSFLNGQRISVGVARVGDEVAFDQLRFRVDAVARHGQQTVAVRHRPAEVRRAPKWPWVAVAIALAIGLAAVFVAR